VSEYYLGQIMLTGFTYAPKFFAQCNGQLMPIPQNQALFSLIGTIYGGDGVRTFALPDLRGRTPMGQGNSPMGGNYPIGAVGGVEQVTLSLAQLPQHTHMFAATTTAGAVTIPTASGTYATATIPDGAGTENIYASPSAGADVPLLAGAVTQTGGNQPHNNMQPFRVINFNIALSGIFPSRN